MSDKKSVSITVSADQKHRTLALAEVLRDADGPIDFKVEQVIEDLGLIFGTAPEEVLKVIAKMKGVKAVEVDKKVYVSPLKPEPVKTGDPYFAALMKRSTD